MNTLRMKTIVCALASALGIAGAANAAMTRTEIKTEEDRISTEFKAAKAACDRLAGNAKDICTVQAKGANSVAKADLHVRRDDTVKTRYELRIARAEAEYDVAKERCDDLSGNAKDVCLKDAKAAQTAARSEAKVESETGKANTRAGARVGQAVTDADEDKRKANYAAAKERCDSLAGDAKERCVTEAKQRHGIH